MTEEATKEQTNNLTCPECHSGKLRKEGFTPRYKNRQVIKLQRFRCLDCGLLTTKPNTDHDVNILDPEKPRQVSCSRCDHTWNTLLERPTQCPHCHSSYWDKPKKLHDVNKLNPSKEATA